MAAPQHPERREGHRGGEWRRRSTRNAAKATAAASAGASPVSTSWIGQKWDGGWWSMWSVTPPRSATHCDICSSDPP
ncbi:hypothetical protein V1460_02660 [Streptomyces sp. SCSIO 30461]|uniref:hypothetical protein n=1 Tax=Streptomyces sp. SCSIO 30461 TaxID=3118085 RepID=UPI0030D2494F